MIVTYPDKARALFPASAAGAVCSSTAARLRLQAAGLYYETVGFEVTIYSVLQMLIRPDTHASCLPFYLPIVLKTVTLLYT